MGTGLPAKLSSLSFFSDFKPKKLLCMIVQVYLKTLYNKPLNKTSLIFMLVHISGLLTSQAVDPSRPLPYWDKVCLSYWHISQPIIVHTSVCIRSSAYFSTAPYIWPPRKWDWFFPRPLTPTTRWSTWSWLWVIWTCSFLQTVSAYGSHCWHIMWGTPLWSRVAHVD